MYNSVQFCFKNRILQYAANQLHFFYCYNVLVVPYVSLTITGA